METRLPSASGTVLVVDDNPDMLESTARFLRANGFEVLTTQSPFGVTKLVSRNAPAVVVLDIMMPALDGKKLAELLRTNPMTCAASIVFYSALDEDRVYRLTREIPGSDYALKSDGPDALLATIRSALAKRG